jgi:hypothetical protein
MLNKLKGAKSAVEHAEDRGEIKYAYKIRVFVGKSKAKTLLDLCTDWRITLKWATTTQCMTERRRRVGNIPASYPGGHGFNSRSETGYTD